MLNHSYSSVALISVPVNGGELVVNLGARRVTLGKFEIKLTDIEFRLLWALIAHNGTVVSHRQLLVQVWGAGYITATNVLHVHMKNLRDKLARNDHGANYITNIRGIGYRCDIK
ncbi:MAG: winged helix-turn-helix domain-containing protein [Dehalococcoidales bacterium]|nr:winged helix-turn-helix domain-containing protein [Dehalococcoidales bacterium]